jgi:hypothetical protein
MAEGAGGGSMGVDPTETHGKVALMSKKLLEYAGIAASVLLIIVGIGAAGAGVLGRETVRDNLAREQIVGTPDSSIPGQKVDTGGEAKAFADVMRKHTLEATGGLTYSQMGRFIATDGKPTDDAKAAKVDQQTGQPVENGLRNMWVTETALTTALNTAYFAEQVALFSIVTGLALLLTGIGFLVLTLRVLHPALAGRRRETAANAATVAS